MNHETKRKAMSDERKAGTLIGMMPDKFIRQSL